MPRERSPSVLSDDFHVTRRPPRFVRRWDQEGEGEEGEQQQLEEPNPPPTPPHSVYSVPSCSDDGDDEIQFLGMISNNADNEPSSSVTAANKLIINKYLTTTADKRTKANQANSSSTSKDKKRSTQGDKGNTGNGDKGKIIGVTEEEDDDDDHHSHIPDVDFINPPSPHRPRKRGNDTEEPAVVPVTPVAPPSQVGGEGKKGGKIDRLNRDSRCRSTHRREESRERRNDGRSSDVNQRSRSVAPKRKRRSPTPYRERRLDKWEDSHSYGRYRDCDNGNDYKSQGHQRSSTRHHPDEDKVRRSRSYVGHDHRKRKCRWSSSDSEPDIKDTATQTKTQLPTLKLSEREILRLIKICREPGCDKKKFETRRQSMAHLKEVHDRQLCFVCFHSFPIWGVERTDHFFDAHAEVEGEDERAVCPVESCSHRFGVKGIYQHLSRMHLVPREKLEERRRRRKKGKE